MKEPSFDSTPEFRHFKEVMCGILAVPKTRIDELVREAKENSPRKGNAAGQKPVERKRAPKTISK
jgi:hypothetical protein